MRVYLSRSKRDDKKYTALVHHGNGSTSNVHFGAKGYSDYTKHKDPKRKASYVARHAPP